MSKLLILAASSALALGGLLLWAAPWASQDAPTATVNAVDDGALPELWPVPAFAFPDQRGRVLASEDLAGRVWIADFIYTTCTTACPILTSKMVLLQRALPDAELHFVSFAVDPANDSLAALKQYAHDWNPGETRWSLLRPEPQQLDSLAAGMKVGLAPGVEADNAIIHSSKFFLVDREGMVRGAYDSTGDDDIARLSDHARRLLGKGAPPKAVLTDGRQLYEALGCKACHANPSLAPSLQGLAGRKVALEGGGHVAADASYVKESVLVPGEKIVSGYLNLMPSYAQHLTEAQLNALVATLLESEDFANPAAVATEAENPASGADGSPVRAAVVQRAALRRAATSAASPPSTPVSSAELAPVPEAGIVTDPICGMKVRTGDGALYAEHEGARVYFCSAHCRDRFMADPGRAEKR